MSRKRKEMTAIDSTSENNNQATGLYGNRTMDSRDSPSDITNEDSGDESLKDSSSPDSTLKEEEELTPGGIPERNSEVEARGEFSNRVQYLLACIGYAVGLGNIWRFPSVAYENGGGAFLLPYVIVSILFGLPTLYIECALGQFTQFGPSRAFKFYMPISQGIGWAMSLISLSIALYYNVIVAWSMIYIGYTVSNNMDKFSSCDNYWNSKMNCSDAIKCMNEVNSTRYFNGACYNSTAYSEIVNATALSTGYNLSFVTAPDEFFTYYITEKHLSFEFGSFNWKIAGCLIVCWILTALGLVFGVKWLGRISVITATVPYLIIIILLIRGVSLPGATTGIEAYLTKPDFSKLYHLDTWKAALTQICFSLSVGQGGMLAMASYNKRSHKCFLDAVLVMVADSLMSLIGGVAVFSVLGFMAHESGKGIYEVVPSPLSLAFVAYPEAISQMPVPIVWSLLFFFMIFMLGISTMFGLVEGFITCMCDSHPFFRAHHALTVVGTCITCGVLGIVLFCFQNGFHFFTIFNEYIGSFSLAVIIVFEIIVIVLVYGPRYFFRDMEYQFGRSSSNLGRIFGPQGLVIKLLMCITAPIFALGVFAITLYGMRNPGIVDKIGIETFKYPSWAIAFGLTIALIPLSAIPLLAIINCCKNLRNGMGLGSVFRPSDDHPSIRYSLEKPPSISKFLWPDLSDGNTEKMRIENESTKKEMVT